MQDLRISALEIRIVTPLLQEQLCGSILSQSPRHGRKNQSKIETRASCVSETITLSTNVRHKYRQPDAHAYHHQSISALAIRICLPLLPEQFCRSILTQFPATIAKISQQTIPGRHVYLKQLLCRYVFAKHIANWTRMHITINPFLLWQFDFIPFLLPELLCVFALQIR